MMNGRDTVMLELIQLTRTEGGFELLAEYEEALYAVGGRPHWGQYNTLTGSHELMQSMYPHYRDRRPGALLAPHRPALRFIGRPSPPPCSSPRAAAVFVRARS